MIRLLDKNEAIRQFMANLSRVDVNKVFPIQKMLTCFAFQQLSLKIHINKKHLPYSMYGSLLCLYEFQGFFLQNV